MSVSWMSLKISLIVKSDFIIFMSCIPDALNEGIFPGSLTPPRDVQSCLWPLWPCSDAGLCPAQGLAVRKDRWKCNSAFKKIAEWDWRSTGFRIQHSVQSNLMINPRKEVTNNTPRCHQDLKYRAVGCGKKYNNQKDLRFLESLCRWIYEFKWEL